MLLPYDIIEALRKSDSAPGALAMVRERDGYAVYASYGVPRLLENIADFDPEKPFLAGGQTSSAILPLCEPHAYCVLFGRASFHEAYGQNLASRGSTWSFYNTERLLAPMPEPFDMATFPHAVLSEATKRSLPCVALSVLDLSPFIAFMGQTRPSAHAHRVHADILRLLTRAVKETGRLYRLADQRIVVIHYSHKSADQELLCEQMHAALRRSLGAPRALATGCAQGVSINALDHSSAGILVAFASGL